MTALAVFTAGWAWAHPVFLALYGLGVAVALWALALVSLTPTTKPATSRPRAETVPLPCTQAPPDKPDHVFWASVWAQHVEHDTGEFPALELPAAGTLPPAAGDQLAILSAEIAGERP